MKIRTYSDSFVVSDVLRAHLSTTSGSALVGRIKRAANGLKITLHKEKIEHLHLWVASKDECLAIFDRTCKGVDPKLRKRVEDWMTQKLDIVTCKSNGANKRKSPFSGTGTLYVARCRFDPTIIKPGVTCTGLRLSTRERGVELLRELDMEIVWELENAAHLESYFLQIFCKKPKEEFFERLGHVLTSKGVSDTVVGGSGKRPRRSKELRCCSFATTEELSVYCDGVARTYADAMLRPRKRSALADKERLHEMHLEAERFKLHAAERMCELAQMEHERQTQARIGRMEEECRRLAGEAKLEELKQKRLGMLLSSDKVKIADLEHLMSI